MTAGPIDRLASVIVPCLGPLEETRRCVAALARRTRPPWHLVAVVAAGDDATAGYLAGVADAAPFPVTVAAAPGPLPGDDAFGIGLAAARGEFVALLAPDAIVPDGWLDALSALAGAGPAIGPVGPMSNRAGPHQRVPDATYADPAGLDRFAADWRAEHRGRWLTVDALDGPCLLVRCAALESLGGLGAGVADLCARARAAGMEPAVARDLFVHRGPLADAPAAARVVPLGPAEFARRFGVPDLSRALLGYTGAADAAVVLALAAHSRPLRVLEVGTAFGHMTANLAAWSHPNARVVSLGIVAGMGPEGAPEQGYEVPSRADFGRLAGHFGNGHKVTLIAADSEGFDFRALAPLDFAFVDGGHDLAHALGDSRGAYDALAPGGYLVWHDVGSPHPWIRVDEAIARLAPAEPVYHVAGTQVAFLRKAGPGPDPTAADGLAPSAGPVRATWEGDWRGRHSLGLINRALARALLGRGHDLGLGDDACPAAEGERLPPVPELEARSGRPPRSGPARVRVSHRWPPRLDPPPEGRWAFFQPWEFGSLPRAWMPALARADEVWAYSGAVRECYLEAGVPEARVRLVPLGVDPDVFRPGVPPMTLLSGPDVRFLFVGGTIHRKGIDLLLAAYERAFRPGDGVGLVVQDMGTASFYRGQTAGAAIAALRDRGYPVEYRAESLDPAELAGLYAACDALVQPYRGEGFALPVAEAMACGLPVIVTGEGPSRDYAGPGVAFPVPARRVALPGRRVGDLETVGVPWLWEPDPEALVEGLRRVAGDREAARSVGRAASDWIRNRYTWANAAGAAEAGLRALADG